MSGATDSTSDRDRFLDNLEEQLEFLDLSCDLYDEGRIAEAKRLATTVRVLVHDTGASTSLLAHLGLKNKLRWADGILVEQLQLMIREQSAGRPMYASLLTTIKLPVGFLDDPGLVRHVPVFEIQAVGERYVPFDYWWETPRLSNSDLVPVGRKDIVLWLANKDGGAHVDGELPNGYLRISRGSTMGVTLANLPGKSWKDDNPIPASMRQIAEEVRHSVRSYLARG